MDRTVVGYVRDGGASGFMEEAGRVTGMRSECENRFIQAEVFVGFRRNLVVATRGLQQEKTVSFGGVLQRSAVGKSGQEVNQILDSELFNVLLKLSFSAARPEVNCKGIRANLTFRF